ncbi:hypothetical protein [Acinetobacter sp.]|uniref:hypothetical protein n=1 Tax=Acinetobacter sp. TaxID=472 RepID=UPI00388DB632
MAHNIVLITWPESSHAFENFSKLKNSPIQNINEITLLKRQENGQFKIEEQMNPDQDTGILSGSLVGALIGILGGPFGIILGFTAGALIGGAYDINNEKNDLAVLGKISQALPLGTAGLLIDIYEDSEEFLDALFEKTGATIYRWSFDDVQSEVEASVEAWHETQRIANQTLKEQKKAEHKAKRQAKWEALKAHFHHAE